MRKIGSRLGGLPLQGTKTQIILPVTLAVLGRSSVVLIADVDWGATFVDLITACGADCLDMLAVGDMVYAWSSGLDAVLAVTWGRSLVVEEALKLSAEDRKIRS